jgi:hypothetical protein
MKQKFAMVAATFALGFLLSAPAGAGDSTKNGGSGGNPPGYGSNWGGSTNSCGNCGGGHNKNGGGGGGGHNKNGGGGNGGNGGGGSGGGTNTSDLILCYVGNRAVYASSVRHCRRMVYSYNYGGHGGGYVADGHGDGYSMSRATRMQLRKRARAGHGYVAHGGRKVHGRKLRHSGVRRARGHGGKTIIVNNYGGQVQINKGGSY